MAGLDWESGEGFAVFDPAEVDDDRGVQDDWGGVDCGGHLGRRDRGAIAVAEKAHFRGVLWGWDGRRGGDCGDDGSDVGRVFRCLSLLVVKKSDVGMAPCITTRERILASKNVE